MQVVERAIVPADEITTILGALNALRRGDGSVRLPSEWPGMLGRVADVFNEVVERNERMAQELERLRAWSARKASSASAARSAT